MSPRRRKPEVEELLTTGEVATMFGVDPKTVTRWCKAGKLPTSRTLGGHRRIRLADVQPLLARRLEAEPKRSKRNTKKK